MDPNLESIALGVFSIASTVILELWIFSLLKENRRLKLGVDDNAVLKRTLDAGVVLDEFEQTIGITAKRVDGYDSGNTSFRPRLKNGNEG